MADKGTKTKAKAKRKPESVLGSLPATRPERLGRPRRAAAQAAREVPVAKVQARGPRPAKPVPPRAKAPAARTHGPAAVSAGCPPLERPHGEPPPRPIGAPSGTELVTTAIQATGELARIGLTVGGQVLKRAVDRIPRP
jgi:hypothetical protein